MENYGLKAQLIGTARVEISCLKFIKGRQIDRRIVDHLKDIFRATKCGRDSKGDSRNDPKHFVPVLLTPTELKNILRASCKSREDLSNESAPPCWLKLPVRDRLLCIDGRHRIAAASEFLRPGNRWWNVRVLLRRDNKPLPPIKDQFLHQSCLSDGEFYLKVHQYKQEQYPSKSKLDSLMAGLSSCKKENLRQLVKHEDKRKTSYFNHLTKFPALFGRLELGNTHRHFALKCHAEIMRYTKHIESTFETITLGSEEVRFALNIETVDALQQRVPGLSSTDRGFIISAMDCGLLFPSITRKRTRKSILKAILSITHLIPSIKSMHENLKLLGEGAKVLKELVAGKNVGESLEDSLRECWTYKGYIYMEVENGRYQKVTQLSETKAWALVYQQLWIAAIRNFADLGGRNPKAEVDGKIQSNTNVKLQHEFVSFARKQGLRPQLSEFHAMDDPRRLALRCSLGKLYTSLSSVALEELVDQVLSRLPATLASESGECFDSTSPRDDLSRRWGVPFYNDYIIGQSYLFFHKVVKELAEAPKDIPTVQFVQQDFIKAFFHPLLDPRLSGGHVSSESDTDNDNDNDTTSGGYEALENSSLTESNHTSPGSNEDGKLSDNMDVDESVHKTPAMSPAKSADGNGEDAVESLPGSRIGEPTNVLQRGVEINKSPYNPVEVPTSIFTGSELEPDQDLMRGMSRSSSIRSLNLPSEPAHSPIEFTTSPSVYSQEPGVEQTAILGNPKLPEDKSSEGSLQQHILRAVGLRDSTQASLTPKATSLSDRQGESGDIITSLVLYRPLQEESSGLSSLANRSSGSENMELPTTPNTNSGVFQLPRLKLTERPLVHPALLDSASSRGSFQLPKDSRQSVLALPLQLFETADTLSAVTPQVLGLPSSNLLAVRTQNTTIHLPILASQEGTHPEQSTLADSLTGTIFNHTTTKPKIFTRSKESKKSKKPMRSINPGVVLFSFTEYNGMKLRHFRLSKVQMQARLDECRGWSMFIHASKTLPGQWSIIPRRSILSTMAQSPKKDYYLVTPHQKAWWFTNGDTYLSQRNLKPTQEVLSQVIMFQKELSFFDCEKIWRDQVTLIQSPYPYLLHYQENGERTIQGFCDWDPQLDDQMSYLKKLDPKFVAIVSRQESYFRDVPWEDVSKWALQFPVWVFARALNEEFFSQLELGPSSNPRLLIPTLPPDTGGPVENESLSESDDHSADNNEVDLNVLTAGQSAEPNTYESQDTTLARSNDSLSTLIKVCELRRLSWQAHTSRRREEKRTEHENHEKRHKRRLIKVGESFEAWKANQFVQESQLREPPAEEEL